MHVVLVAGLTCDASVWRHQARALAATCDVQIADHGDSRSLADMATRILAVAPPRFAIAGHSMGGRVALEVIAQAPERVLRLALLDTGFVALAPGEAGERERATRRGFLETARTKGMGAMARDWARGMVHPARLQDAALMASIHGMIERFPTKVFEAQIEALLTRPDRRALLAGLHLPTLVLCGREDTWSPPANHVEMARLVRGSELVVVSDCGHMSPMERPEAVTSALLGWLGAAGPHRQAARPA